MGLREICPELYRHVCPTIGNISLQLLVSNEERDEESNNPIYNNVHTIAANT